MQNTLWFQLFNNRCRIIQKAVQRIDQDEVCKLVSEFQDKVLLFIHDPNGNHVIQRCIQVMSAFPKQVANDDVVVDDDDCIKPEDDPNSSSMSSLSDQMQFIVDDIVENIEMLSTHRYGCRVVQRAVEHCEAAQKKAVLENIVACLDSLIVDHYGEEMWSLLSCLPIGPLPLHSLLTIVFESYSRSTRTLTTLSRQLRRPTSVRLRWRRPQGGRSRDIDKGRFIAQIFEAQVCEQCCWDCSYAWTSASQGENCAGDFEGQQSAAKSCFRSCAIMLCNDAHSLLFIFPSFLLFRIQEEKTEDTAVSSSYRRIPSPTMWWIGQSKLVRRISSRNLSTSSPPAVQSW